MNTRQNSWLRWPTNNPASEAADCRSRQSTAGLIPDMNIQQALQAGNRTLAESSSSAALDAQVLLAFVLQCNSAHLAAWLEKKLTKAQLYGYQHLLAQREKGIPVAHLTGQREFWSLNFAVNSSTLIPRPETETLVEYILEEFNTESGLKLLDMGTGTGAIAVSVALEKPGWEIFACEISGQALELAQLNSNFHRTDNVTLIKSNWFENIKPDDFDIIVSNPPYIADNDPHLQQGDVRFEPERALTSGTTGMNDIEHICLHAVNYLKTGGQLIVEHGYQQKLMVADCFAKNGYIEIEQKQDLSGHTRMTAGKKQF